MPQREFARKNGLAQSTIMRIENLDQNVTLDTLEQMCRSFHVDIAELFPVVESPRVYPSIGTQPAAAAGTLHEKKPAGRK